MGKYLAEVSQGNLQPSLDQSEYETTVNLRIIIKKRFKWEVTVPHSAHQLIVQSEDTAARRSLVSLVIYVVAHQKKKKKKNPIKKEGY